MELREDLPPNLEPFEKLQDIIGTLVNLETGKKVKETAASPTGFLPVAQDEH
jgi:hypothetical protein